MEITLRKKPVRHDIYPYAQQHGLTHEKWVIDISGPGSYGWLFCASLSHKIVDHTDRGPAGVWYSIGLNREFEIARHHDWYDGPIDGLSIGWLRFGTNAFMCVKCEKTVCSDCCDGACVAHGTKKVS